MVDELITSASLPCVDCVRPIVDESLRCHHGVYVSEPLAELEPGPVSSTSSAPDEPATAWRPPAAVRTTR